MTRDDRAHPGTPGYTLLTGATGLLGRYLLRDLLAAGHLVAVLVRPANGLEPAARIDAVLSHWEQNGFEPLPRPMALSGDVGTAGLGLDASARRWIAEHVTRLIHGAAVTRFHGRSRSGDPWLTNERGATEVIALCRELDIQDLHHISTAYVAGSRQGDVLESELAMGQGFRNDYEESKFLAEEALQAADDIPYRTVHRPGVIAGDSETGYTSAYHGLYVYLRVMSFVLPRTRPGTDGIRRVPYAPSMPLDARRNIVPVDWVSKVMVRLLETTAARGHVYHLTPEHAITTRELLDALGSWYGGYAVELCAPNALDRGLSHLSRGTRMLKSYEAYGAGEPSFDRRNVERFAGDIPCPPLDEATVHRYLAFAEQDAWGRRRNP